MIKTKKMAEAVRPKHRKQTKIKKVKPVTKSREISPINDPLSEIQADKEDILVISSDITEDSFKDTNLPDLLLERNTLKEDVIVKLKDGSSEVSSEIQSELGGLTSEHQAPSKTQPALKEDVIVKLKDESSEVSSDKQSEIGSLTSEHQAPSKTQPACLENENQNVNSKGIEKCVASEPHNLPQRPQNLPSLMLSSKQQFPELSTGSGASLQDISSSKNTFSEHQNGKPSIRTSMELPSPAVVEDPNTPMSRTVSPSTPKIVKEKTSPTVPAIILEEKSPNLLAQEAIARMKNLNIVSSSASEVTSSPVLQQTGSSSCHKSESIASQQAQFNLLSSRTQTMSPQHIYPIHQLEQTKEITKTPMSLTDLLSLYYNPELATNERFVEEFTQKEIKKENHEFYEIVSNYNRARRQLLSVEEDIKTLQKNYTALQKEVWITHVKSLSVQGTCADQARVYATHTYEQCELIADNLSKIGSTLENIRLQICDNLSLFAYTSQISKLQVESYIHNLYLSCPTFRDMAKNMPIPARHDAPFAEQHDIQRIKDCISVLFVFHRKPIFDTEFVTNIRQWTVRLISSLLRVASFSDHLFVLNHLLRCPSGVGKWSAELVQCPRFQGNPTQYQSNFSCPMLNHTITAMATVLLPVKAREEFMHQMQMNLNEQSGSDDRAWILVDSDGEEDEDPSNSWLYLHENDIVAFLRQFPLADIFSYILLSSITETGAVDYDIRRSTEPMMLRLFAFTTTLIQLLGTGLVTYSMARYRQLNKRLGRLIRQAISFVSDHWLNFKTYYGPLSPASMQNLQIEFDQLFMRATYSILKAQRDARPALLGSWQFMADMPYTCVSMDSMWQLLWVLHQGEGISVDMLPPVETCKTYLKNSDSWQQLADNLMHMPTSEAIYLLTTFANMAVCRSSEEEVFIHLITLEVFEIAYICNHTREFCNKVGRELLSSIILTHPTALSFLLTRVKEVMDKLGKMALYLFSELPVSIWQPTDPDILTLRQWLLNHELISNENQLAQIILAKINWDVFEETGKLVVDIRIHRQIALLLVEAYSKFISDKKAGFFILEGMKYMSSYLSYVTSNLSPEQKFNNWVWNVALRLKLHQHSVTLHSSGALDLNFNPPTLGGDTWLTPLHRATSSKIPIACFVTLTMTNIGHNITNFISEGLDLLGVLTANYQYTTAVHILGCVVPLFTDSQHYLLENSSFCQILQTLLGADESLLKSTKAAIMTVEFPGLVTQQLSQMIQAQVTSHLVHNKADLYILFWLKAIFKVCKYFTDRNSCYIADTLIRWSFVKKGVLDLITDIFKENYKKFCVAVKNRQGLVTSMFSWIANANTLPTFMEGASMPEFSWLAYMILSIEGEYEVNTSLWQTLIMELHAPNRPTVENALKAAVLRLQLDQSPSVARLTIYRWAHQALDTPPDHPLLPIMWQRFFALFLGRQVFESNISQRASVGERFFSNTFYNSLLKKMRKCLSDTSAFHLNYDPAADASKRKKSSHSSYTTPPSSPRTPVDCDVFDGTAASAPSQDESFEYTSSKEFHVMLARLYQMYKLWLEEPRLHDGNLYLPALPPQYESARLNQVFQGFMTPWLEFVDLEGIQYNLSCMASDWKKHLTSAKAHLPKTHMLSSNEPKNATERILRRLRRFDPPKDPPPVPTIQSAVPLINPTLVDDKTSFITMVQADQQVFIFFTKDFSDRHAHHCALDFNYLELLPNLYSNIKKTTTVLAECKSKVNPLHKCSNPAIIPISIEVKHLNEMVQRRLEENRAEYQQVLIQSFLPPAPNVCIAAVHTENAITMLIKQNQACTDEARLQNLNAIGCSIFYSMVNSVCDQTDFYPPARQFFASCIEVLGREFISRDQNQTHIVLQLCLEKPSVSGLVSPHFIPNNCPESLLDMYQQLLQVLQSQNLDLVFALLTKFNIQQWLKESSPSEISRKRFIEVLGSAMMSCGAELNAKTKLVFGMYLSHLAATIESNFPSNLYFAFNMILQGSATEQLNSKVWETLLKSCFTDQLLVTESVTNSQTFDPSVVKACVDSTLSTIQVKELLDWISSFFMHARINDTNCLTFGLYNRWGMYVPYISLMIGALSRCLVTKIIKSSKSLTPYQIMEFIWQPLVAVISPWLQPLLQADGTFALPWMEADDVLAVHLISSFYNTVLYIYQMMNSYEAGSGSGVMSLLVMYYMTALCTKTTKSHVIHLLVTESKILPWKELRPDLQLLEAMIRVKEVASPCCFAFIGYIIPQVQWQEIIDYSKSQLHPEVACRMQTGVAILLMQSYIDTEMAENEPISELLLAGEKFDWSLINREGFSCVCQWFLQLCDPKCVLGEWSSRPALGLRLLKQMAGFHTNVQWTEVVSVKREIYLHCVSQQICHATYLAGIKIDAVCTVLINLLSEIEAIETSVPTVGHQEEESSKLLKEIFSLLNNSNPEGSWLESMLSELTGWLKSSPQSIMLVPSIKAASRSLASLRHMCTVLEAGVEAYFDGYDQSSEGLQGWPFVLTVYQVPELNQAGYVQDALSVNAFLVLFAYLQHKLPFCQKLSDELVIMEEILDWSSKCQAQAKDEAKIILWWHLLLRLIVRQLEFSISPITGTINIVSRFINYLNEIAQERTGKGLLGAIGLGQRSALSQSMRLVAKSLAIFLASQVISSEVIRTNPTSRPSSNVNVSDLRTLRKNKSYAHLSGTIDHILSFVQNADNTMKDVLPLFGQIVTDLYSDKRYLYEVMEVNTR
ncbi:ectopic P granules protein 5 homolog isoform X1 [Biomphalaria glabrata]|uniref:Ectopic P granules protein 5 homolog isoform X1 n=1 Tax=Biomphalaria glabrata TaxID=6526 RepID=A0A9W3A719_BIOGL|nr:ectopic P granules protein 5 homolog isoform X1 [Biomphalaria glabrata]